MKGLLTAAGLFPHPPIMVPEIGGKETKKIQQTMDAVRKSMKLIMETDPETVVVKLTIFLHFFLSNHPQSRANKYTI